MSQNSNGEFVESGYKDEVARVDDVRLAAIVMVFGGVPRAHCPIDWIDEYKNLEQYCRYQEELSKRREGCRPDRQHDPKTYTFFNFEKLKIPFGEILKAVGKDYAELIAAFSQTIADLPVEQQKQIRAAHSNVIARACLDAVQKCEFLVGEKRRMPERAKWDFIHGHDKACVQMGKRSSPEMKARLLSTLTRG